MLSPSLSGSAARASQPWNNENPAHHTTAPKHLYSLQLKRIKIEFVPKGIKCRKFWQKLPWEDCQTPSSASKLSLNVRSVPVYLMGTQNMKAETPWLCASPAAHNPRPSHCLHFAASGGQAEHFIPNPVDCFTPGRHSRNAGGIPGSSQMLAPVAIPERASALPG